MKEIESIKFEKNYMIIEVLNKNIHSVECCGVKETSATGEFKFDLFSLNDLTEPSFVFLLLKV